eukprot:1055160-Rhodomonas_salina.1
MSRRTGGWYNGSFQRPLRRAGSWLNSHSAHHPTGTVRGPRPRSSVLTSCASNTSFKPVLGCTFLNWRDTARTARWLVCPAAS